MWIGRTRVTLSLPYLTNIVPAQRQIATTPLPTCLGSRTRATRVRKCLARLELHRSNLCQAPRGKASHALVGEHRRLDIGEPEAPVTPEQACIVNEGLEAALGHENEVVAQRAHRRRAHRLPRTDNRRKFRSVGLPDGRVRRHVMDVRLLGFGSIGVDGRTYEHDIVIDRGVVRKRSKKPSKPYRDKFGHTPLSADEELPWGGPRLIIGTGAHGSLPIMPEVVAEAARRNIKLVAVPTEQACRLALDRGTDTAGSCVLFGGEPIGGIHAALAEWRTPLRQAAVR